MVILAKGPGPGEDAAHARDRLASGTFPRAEEAGPEFHFSGNGTVFSHTTIHTPPEGFEAQVPYTVALIKLDDALARNDLEQGAKSLQLLYDCEPALTQKMRNEQSFGSPKENSICSPIAFMPMRKNACPMHPTKRATINMVTVFNTWASPIKKF